ncbi:aspartyl-tRNA synthetase [Exophiala aquamarina CBS 119918]|uniref:Probable aspartate--tRNA ligase, cytoplasmic n=1 Tax=Exophiala aquamarina CBS 119918 TaxID=1182545 RepID=A0A072PKK7_9EURO|nr:aspartyl-tRNA synthetase [Exophiala aquamarina CBS 119918]KEF56060.1 aspartyl-tRNA synthetase [Exophiala aquamarina CBS 119918]
MSKVKSAVSNIGVQISHRKDDINSKLGLHDHEESRGGSEQDVVHVIHDEIDDWSSTEDEEQYGHQSYPAKDLEEFLQNDDPPEVRRNYGRLPLMQSQDNAFDPKQKIGWTRLVEIGPKMIGKEISFRARIHVVRHMSAAMAFILFRENITTVQGVLSAREDGVSESMVRWAQHIRPGSIVLVQATAKQPDKQIHGASTHDVELLIQQLHVVSARKAPVPFSVYEAEGATDGRAIADRVRLRNRILDLRTPTSQAIFRIQSEVCRTFRSFLDQHEFLEIHTPKLQGGATEGGADVFKLDYFGRPAFLAQSPQLAKQMCISADMERVYEIGPVFRAENSNTPRHMTEYVGLDVELAISHHYHEAMWLIDATLKEIFRTVHDRHQNDIATLKHHFPHEKLIWLPQTPRITFAQGVQLLNDSGWENDSGKPQSEDEDLPTQAERRLGELIKEKFKTDYYILDKFPTASRPFYTMLDPDNDKVTNSFDFMVRGQEILSGGQRVHEYEVLVERMKTSEMDTDSLKEYMQGFEWIAPPHAGAGIGLERLISLILDLGNVRYATLFPRDPKSFPQAKLSSDLPHPEDSTLQRPKGHLPNLENLVANYGDATNTSWMDERFKIWRDEKTGAAISYVPTHDRAICAGNPLCDQKQLEDVITAFLKWLRRETKLRPLFILVGKDVEDILADRLGWKSFTNVSEQRVNLASNGHLDVSSDVDRKIRHARKESVQVNRYGDNVPEDVRKRCEERIEGWKESKTGSQVHLSDITPFADARHRQYFVAEDPQGKIHSLVVLALLASRWGVQVKWALDFPGATNGAIELAVFTALKSAADAGTKTCTFGAGAASRLTTGRKVGRVKSAALNSLYQTLAAKFNLDQKTGFRSKFNTLDDPLFLCYPPRGLGPKGAQAIVDFFQTE